MSRFTWCVCGSLAAMLALGAMVEKRPPPVEYDRTSAPMPPRTVFPEPDQAGDRQPLDVLTRPHYQDVPALNRLIIPADAY